MMVKSAVLGAALYAALAGSALATGPSINVSAISRKSWAVV
jgi:hypothetical protein